MRGYLVYFCLLLGCSESVVEKPILALEGELVNSPVNAVFFSAQKGKWQARLLTFTQPIPLSIKETEGGFQVSQKDRFGLCAGPATFELECDGKCFYYPVVLQNEVEPLADLKDFRSPKTVNPDSCLSHQRIIHKIDQWRNLVQLDNSTKYFHEEMVSLSAQAATYRAISEKPLTSFYVQAGTCANIPLSVRFNELKKMYRVEVGPLKDKFNNDVTDGTMVVFKFECEERWYRFEAQCQKAYAHIEFDANPDQLIKLHVIIDQVQSQTIYF